MKEQMNWQRKELIEKKYWISYEKHINTELDQDEKKRIWDEVEAETRQMEIENREAARERLEQGESPPVKAKKISAADEMEEYYKKKEERAAAQRVVKMTKGLVSRLGVAQKVKDYKDFKDEAEL